MGILHGKRGLIMGVANERSIAWGISQKLAEAGTLPAEIADKLNKKGVRGKKGGLWSRNQVLRTIEQPFHSNLNKFTRPAKPEKAKPKPKPSKEVVIAALEESLSNQIESLTSYSSSQSTYIQVGAFRKENVSLRIADDISNKLGTTVEVIPTLVSEPVMYRILVGPEHKDDIIETIADLMELGISDYFLTHG